MPDLSATVSPLACNGPCGVPPASPARGDGLVAQPAVHAWLHAWKRTWIAETSEAYIVETRGWWQRELAVFDRRTLVCRHRAIGRRWRRGWTDLPAGSVGRTPAGTH
jgi:hypothetical protein